MLKTIASEKAISNYLMVTKPLETMVPKITLKDRLSTPHELFIGIDVHAKSWHVSLCSQSLVLKHFSQPPKPEALIAYLHKHYPGYRYHSVYEAGYCGFWIHRELQDAGIENIVVNPCDVPTTDKEKRQKRDSVDSLKLCKALRSGLLTGIYVPSPEQQDDRSLLRVRKQLVGDITRYKHRIKMHLHSKGIEIPEDFLKSKGYWKKAFKNWLSQLQLHTTAGTEALKQQVQALFLLEKQLSLANAAVRQLATSPAFASKIELITSVPGVGLLSGMVLLTEIGDIKRFKQADQLNSFVGLIPNIYASGEKEHVGDLTKRGNSYLRTTLVECAWAAVGKDPALTQAYEALRRRMNGNKAIIRIARKLLARIRYVLSNEKFYQYGISTVQ